jgi:hypothetical protein
MKNHRQTFHLPSNFSFKYIDRINKSTIQFPSPAPKTQVIINLFSNSPIF